MDFDDRILKALKSVYAKGGYVLEDDYPTHYLPHVGRQVMAGGGAPSIDQIRQMLVGTAPAPSAPSPGAYTDPYGLKVAAPFVESMRGGYPTPPSVTTPAPSRSSFSDLLGSIFGRMRSGRADGGEVEGEVSFLEDEKSPLPTFAQPQTQQITQALDAAREVSQPKKEYEPFGVLPLRETEAGIEFDPYAGVLGSMTRPAKYFYETMTGQKEMEPTSEEAIRAATDIAGTLTMGSGAFERPAGALAAGVIRPGWKTPKSVWHVTSEPFEPKNILSSSHVGTAKSSTDRASDLVLKPAYSDPERLYFHQYKYAPSGNVYKTRDSWGGATPEGDILKEMWTEGVIPPKEMPWLKDREDLLKAFEEARKVRNISTISYRNKVEDPGKESHIVYDPERLVHSSTREVIPDREEIRALLDNEQKRQQQIRNALSYKDFINALDSGSIDLPSPKEFLSRYFMDFINKKGRATGGEVENALDVARALR